MAAVEKAGAAVADARLLVAVDDGYAQTKIIVPRGMGSARDGIRIMAPTSVRAGLDGLSAIDGSATAGYYETNGRRYTASDAVIAEQTRFDGFHLSDIDRVAVHHGLHLAGLAGREVELVCGLPVGDFYAMGGKNEALIASKKASLMTPVELKRGAGDSDKVNVVDVQICAQAVASWVDYVLHDDLSAREGVDLDDTVAVVDIGGRTTDCAIVVGGRSIDHGRSGTENIGVLDVQERFAQLLGKSFDFPERLPAKQYDTAIRSGSIRLFGEQHDVSELVNEAIRDVEGRIERVVSRLVGSGADLAAVLFVGGGAMLFPGLSKRYRNGVLLEDAVFSNARGMWKYIGMQRVEVANAA